MPKVMEELAASNGQRLVRIVHGHAVRKPVLQHEPVHDADDIHLVVPIRVFHAVQHRGGQSALETRALREGDQVPLQLGTALDEARERRSLASSFTLRLRVAMYVSVGSRLWAMTPG
jgi:hypothetical protein